MANQTYLKDYRVSWHAGLSAKESGVRITARNLLNLGKTGTITQ